MLLICCPYCGPRSELEFAYGGEAHIARPGRNPKGMHAERWRHLHGCGRFFNARRDTVTDTIAATYPAGEQPPVAASKETKR